MNDSISKKAVRTSYILSIAVFSITILLIILGYKIDMFTTYAGGILTLSGGIIINIICLYIIHINADKKKQVYISNTIQSEMTKFHDYTNLNSNLSEERKAEITKQLKTVYPHFVNFRIKQLGKTHKKLWKKYKRAPKQYVQNCAWSSISTTNSELGYRFVLGFRNYGCSFWRHAPFYIGCYNCGYCSSILPIVRPKDHDLEMQFENALADALKVGTKFDTIEFLNDGSFFNDQEISSDLRKYLLKRINSLEYVKTILVETRPEYLDKAKISDFLTQLNDDKRVVIGMGLETSDDFVRTACINKGYDMVDFENAIACLSEFRDRVEVVVYTLVMPAFLTENEAIEDIISTSKQLSLLSEKHNIKITVKLEPAVVSQATILDLLYFGDKDTLTATYSVLSYWSIVEILCRLHTDNIKISARVGAREDMDVVEKIPGVYTVRGRLDDYDFVIYDSIQDFNINGSLPEMLLRIEEALKDPSFLAWKETLNKSTTAIEKCCKELDSEIGICRNNELIQDKMRFLKHVYRALDLIEYGGESIKYAKKLYKKKNKITAEEVKDRVTDFVQKQFTEIIDSLQVKVLDLFFERDSVNLLRVNIQIRDLNRENAVTSVWAGIPTKKHTNLDMDNKGKSYNY